MTGSDPNITATLQIRDEMSKGLAKISEQVGALGKEFTTAQKQMAAAMAGASAQMEKSGKVVTDTLGKMDQGSLKSIGRFTQLTGRLVGLQAGLASLGQIAGQSGAEMGKGFKTAQSALSSFAAVVGFLPTPAGVAAGAVAALATAMVQLVDTTAGRSLLGLIDPDLETKFKAQMDRTAKLRIELTNLDDAWKKLGVSLELTSRDRMETARAQFSALQNQALKLKDILPGLRDELQGAFNSLKGTALNRDRKLLDQMGLSLDEGDMKQFENLYFQLRQLNDGHGGTEFTRAAIDALGTAFQNFQNVAKRLGITLDDLRTKEVGLIGLEVEKLGQNFQTIATIGAESVRVGLSTPLEAAAADATAARANVDALLRLIQRLKGMQVADPETAKAIASTIKALEGSTLGEFVGRARETEELRKQREEWERLQKIARSMDFKLAFEDAAREFTDTFRSLKDVFLDAFQMMQHAGADAFAALMGHGKKFKNVMREIFRDLGNSFKRMLADFASQELFRGLLSPFVPRLPSLSPGGAAPGMPGGAMQMAAPGVSPMGAAMGLGMLAPAVQPAGSGGFLAGLFGGEGMFGMSAGATGLVGGLGLMGASQAKDPVSGGLMGAAGGAMLGVSLLGGPVGWALGLLGGGAMGIFSGSKAKREQEKAKEEQEEAERQAAEALEAQRKAAANIIRTHIRTSLGGGLADTSAMASVGSLFSGDISPEEVQQFGNVEAILARGAEVSGLAAAQGGNVTNLGGVSIQVRVENVASTYDVQQLATDLGYYLQQNFAGA